MDSTSIGTLLIPIWLLLGVGSLHTGRFLGYLLTIAAFYFGVGLLIVLGADTALASLGGSLDSRPVLWLQLVIGVMLFIVSFRFDSKRAGSHARVERWKLRTQAANAATGVLVPLALFAGLAEVATMLPYLGAIAILASSDLNSPANFGLLAAYCLIMIAPALVLLACRKLAEMRIQPILLRIDGWITRNAESALGWVIGIAGFLVARDAIGRLSLLEMLG